MATKAQVESLVNRIKSLRNALDEIKIYIEQMQSRGRYPSATWKMADDALKADKEAE